MNTKTYVVYKTSPSGTEYLCKVKPYHEYTKDKSAAMKFTHNQAHKIWKPLYNSEKQYKGYSTFGFGQ